MSLYLQKPNPQKKNEEQIDENFSKIDLQHYRYTNKKSNDLQKLPYIENKCHDYNQQLGPYMRKYFEIPSKITKSHVEKWIDQIRKKPFIMLYILDNYFFKKLYDYITINKYNMKAFKIFKQIEFKNFMILLKQKMKRFTQIYQECSKQIMKQFKASLQNQNKKLDNETQNSIPCETKYIIVNLEYICEYSKKILIFYEKNINNQMNQKIFQIVKQQLFLTYIKDSLFQRWRISSDQAPKKKQQKVTNEQLIKAKATFIPLQQYQQFIQKILIKLQPLLQFFYLKYLQFQQQPMNSSFNNKSSVIQSLFVTIMKNKSFLMKNKQSYLQKIQIQSPISLKCISCAQFFYHKLLIPYEKCALVDYQTICSIETIKESAKLPLLVKHINAFLNSPNGGVILFGLSSELMGSRAYGKALELADQQAYKSSFLDLFKYIQSENINNSILCEIDFVPIKQNPYENQGQVKQNSFLGPQVQRYFIQKYVVMRIKLKSNDPKKFYYSKIQKDKNYYFIRRKKTTYQLKGEEIYNEIKKRKIIYENLSKQHLTVIHQQDRQFFSEILRKRNKPLNNFHHEKCNQITISPTQSNSRPIDSNVKK